MRSIVCGTRVANPNLQDHWLMNSSSRKTLRVFVTGAWSYSYFHKDSRSEVCCLCMSPYMDGLKEAKVETPIHDNIRKLVTWECKEHGVKS
jgi:hypothetical protein